MKWMSIYILSNNLMRKLQMSLSASWRNIVIMKFKNSEKNRAIMLIVKYTAFSCCSASSLVKYNSVFVVTVRYMSISLKS